MRSTTTSWLKRRRYAFASRIDEIAASGSSAFTWMIGMSKPLARSLEYRVERQSAGDDGVDRALALELAQDDLVRPADDVREHVEPAAVRHADHDFVRARVCGELDRLVEHRHHRVEALDRELLLSEERAAQIQFHSLD